MTDARLTAMTFLLVAACSAEPRSQGPAPLSERTPQEHKVTKPMQGRLSQLKSLIGIDQQAFIDRFGVKPEHIRSPAVYERMKNVTEIHRPDHPDLGPARFFFRDAKLALIYLSDATALQELNIDSWKGNPSDEGTLLRSRAGKTSNLHVYADKGFAVSEGTEIDFVEIFQPTTQQEYEQAIYDPPGPFRL